MQDSISRALLETIVYSDIFDYPLLKSQLWKFLICQRIDRKSLEEYLKNNLPKKINFNKSFYYLSGRRSIVKTRIERKKESQRKIVIAKKIIKILSCLPTIQFIGISGALSLENSERDDDIDLFVITSKGRIWLTRFAMIVILLFIGRYRRRNQGEVSDKICLNMIIDESALRFPKNRQDLYTVHEIAQLMPIFERNGMYQRFINANRWIEKFLPNAFANRGSTLNKTRNQADSFFSVFQRLVLRISAIEYLAKIVQLWSIKKHLTTETIRNGFLAFHPLDYKKKVLSEYIRRLKNHGL